jgi:predicted tellurium resistance membrane protein TerC
MPVKTPWHLWVVGIVSLLWNAMGGVDYTLTHMHNQSWLAAMTPEQLAWVDQFPVWATSCWALGVWGAIAGSLLVLMRSRWAVHAFGLSLLGLIGSHIYQYTSDAPAGMNTASGTVFAAVLAIIAAALLWYAQRMRKAGLLK